jgi:energy-converting hydrogenase B subunit D
MIGETLATLLDALIAATLTGLALGAILSSQLYRAVVLFIAFGILAAVTWARLDAVDVGLAEAAIGAGVTGALLLDAAGHMGGWRETLLASRPNAEREERDHDATQ